MCSILLIPPVTTRSQHSIYTLFRGHKGGMITMEHQDVMVEMELQGDKEKKWRFWFAGTNWPTMYAL